jgi:hypothetical protein
MPRTIGYWAASAVAAAGLAWAGWPAAAGTVATVVNRVDVIVAVLLLAGLPWRGRRIFGPAGTSRSARVVRASGYATVFTLVAVKTVVARSAGPRPVGGPALGGVWVGEIVFLAVVAAYLVWVLAVTSRRPVASPPALATGTVAGAAAGLLMFVLPPRGGLLHLHAAWPAGLYRAGQALAILLALATGIAAGVLTARRTRRQDGGGSPGRPLPLAETRARQGLAAGLCAGMTAALVTCVLHTGAIALLPHQVQPLHWAFNATGRAPRPVTINSLTETLDRPQISVGANGLADFEMSIADTAAGYLLALVFFPLFGAGLGAWGALYTAGRPKPGNGGGGGGGGEPEPAAPPPDGGRRQDEDYRPAILRGYLKELPAGSGLPTPGDERPVPDRSGRIPVGVRGRPWSAWPDSRPARATSRRKRAARSGPP